MAAGRVIDHFEVHRFRPREHAGFVYGTFAVSLRRSRPELRFALTRPGTLVLVATPVGEPELIGWLASRPAENRIVCAYTKAAYRASVEQRQGSEKAEDAFRIASSLALEAGIDFGREVPCSFWSRAAKRIAAKPGNPYRLRFSPEPSPGVTVIDESDLARGRVGMVTG